MSKRKAFKAHNAFVAAPTHNTSGQYKAITEHERMNISMHRRVGELPSSNVHIYLLVTTRQHNFIRVLMTLF